MEHRTSLLLRFLFIARNISRSEVDWTNAAQANLIKSKVDFHRYVLQALVNLIQLHKNARLLNKQETKEVYDGCTEIALILYARCIVRMKEFIDFDAATAVLAAECFHDIVLLISAHFGGHFQNFLCSVGKRNAFFVFLAFTIILDFFIRMFGSCYKRVKKWINMNFPSLRSSLNNSSKISAFIGHQKLAKMKRI